MICTEKKYAQMHMEFIHGMCTLKAGICAENEYAQED